MSNPKPLNVAIVGCGNISQKYAKTIVAHADKLKLVGATDIRQEAADKLVAEFGGKAYASLDELLADPQVDVVVNLTIHQAHTEVITKALNAGKHVHSEKPLTLNVGEAMELVALAERKKLRLSSAPITFMGEAQQTAWKLIREGKLGEIRVVYAEMNWNRIERWHPAPEGFYEAGALADVGVYPLTVLTTILGPAKRVSAFGKVVKPERTTAQDRTFTIASTPDWICANIEFASGAVCRLTSSFYVGPTKQHGIEFHGDLGSMWLQSPHNFEVKVEFCPWDSKEWVVVPPIREPYIGVDWARGLTEMYDAIRDNRPQRATGAQAAHVVEIIFGAYKAAQTGHAVDLKSTFTPPTPMDWAR